MNNIAKSQATSDSTALRSLFTLDLGLQGVGVGYDKPLGKKWLLIGSAGIGGGYFILPSEFNYNMSLTNPSFYTRANIRYVYSQKKRLSNGRSLALNAASYVGYQTKVATGDFRRVQNNYLSWLNEVHWGIQRPISPKTVFNLHLGIGVGESYGDVAAYLSLGAQFRFSLIKSQRNSSSF